jgi:hypothetical protein
MAELELQKAGHVKVTWFSFFQGLESPSSAGTPTAVTSG